MGGSPAVLEDGTYPALFSGSYRFREFLEQPVPVLGNRSIHDVYDEIRLFSN